jgi:hypothetical protein
MVFAWNPNGAVERAKLDDRFAYVRVEHNNRLSLLALAYVEPTDAGNPRRVFVSGSNETLTLEEGVITAFSSDARQWSMHKGRVVAQPGYAWSPSPAKPVAAVPSQSIQSMVILSVSTGAADLVWQPIAGGWAAFGSRNGKLGRWRFTYQCLEKDFCLAVQAWSSQMQQNQKAGR